MHRFTPEQQFSIRIGFKVAGNFWKYMETCLPITMDGNVLLLLSSE